MFAQQISDETSNLSLNRRERQRGCQWGTTNSGQDTPPAVYTGPAIVHLINHEEDKGYKIIWTYIAEDVDKGIIAAVGHGEPVTAEVDDVDVPIAGIGFSSISNM